MKIIVGLGNPGKKYENTRHNAGFMAVDALARKLGLKWKLNEKLKAEIIKDGDMILAKPITFMNNSGEATQNILSFFKESPENLTVIHDDLDMIIGTHKIKTGSSAAGLPDRARRAGHNGVQSIIDRLGTKKFRRVKIGVEMKEGRLARKIPGEKFVLQKFKKEEMEIIKKLLPEIIKEIL